MSFDRRDGFGDRPLSHTDRITLLGRIIASAVLLVVVAAVFHGFWWALVAFVFLVAVLGLAVWAEWKTDR